ncbi:MAG: polyribonucleotide nucleotidyltransferase, partial [Patescibacteria group bacterium]
MKIVEKTIDLGGKKLTLQTGKLAGQADGSVLVTCGETVVLATAVSSPLKADLGYFPLTVEYMEKLYSGGKIKGSRWVKRDGRPADAEILTARLIDRSIRPLFPKEYMMEVQVIATVLSVDLENDPGITAAIGISAALASSTIPWSGPVAPVRVSLKDKKYSVNPTTYEMKDSEMDLIVSKTKHAVVMIEAGA